MSASTRPDASPSSRLSFDEDWVTVATFRDLAEAEMARVTLVAEDIRCYLADAEVIRLDWTLSMALGGIKLRVPAADRERALARLHRTSTAQELRLVSGGVATADADLRCPACGAPAVRRIDRGRKLSLAAVLLGLPLLVRFRRSRCEACGHRWAGRS